MKLIRNKIIYISFCLGISMFFYSCTSVKLEVESTDYLDKMADPVLADGYTSMWNNLEKGVQKCEVESGNTLPLGVDFIGSDANASVIYKISYWDSLLTVLSLGYYSPFSIEYLRTKKYQKELSDEIKSLKGVE